MVTINGVLQHPSNASTPRAYTLIASIIQFTAAPAVGDEIQVRHLGFAGATTADVSGFYGRTGNVVLTSNDHITTGDITARNINASGILTASSASFGGNVSIGGTLTYEDVTNIDSVGLVTARGGIFIPDSQKIEIGHLAGNPDLRIQSMPSLEQVSIDYNRTGAGRALRIRSTFTQFENWNGLTPIAKFIGGVGVGHVELNYAGSKKFETTNTGAIVTGILTATSADINGDLDVDGHTNLDNVSIAGVTTITGSGNALEIVGGVVRNRGTTSARFVANNGSAEGYFGWSGGALTVGQASATLSLESSGSNHIQLKTNGNERLRITSDGKVGINRNNPDALLHIFNSGTSVLPLKVYRNDVGDVPIVHFQGYNNAIGVVDKFVVTARGRVGVNTDNPQRELHIKPSDNNPATAVPGYIRVEGNGSDQAAILELYHTRGNGSDKWPSSVASVDGGLTLNVANGNNGAPQEKVRITSDGKIAVAAGGNVGFATDSNTYIEQDGLDRISFVVGGVRTISMVEASNMPVLVIDKNGTNTHGTQGAGYYANPHANDLVIGNVSSGNHGMTICTPSSGHGNINFSDGNQNAGHDSYRGSVGYNHSTEQMIVRAKSGAVILKNNATDTLVATSSGKVGIGSDAPTTGKLEIADSAQTNLLTLKRTSGNSGELSVQIGGSDPGVIFNTSGLSDDFVFRPGGNERLRINSNGTITTTQSSSNIGIDLHATGSGRGSQVKFHNDHGVAYVGTAGDTTGNFLIYNETNTPMLFYSGGVNTLNLYSNREARFSGYVVAQTMGSGTSANTASFGATQSGMDANTYNFILSGSNDQGNRCVLFVNGSTRSADGGANTLTFRNDGGNLRLGNSGTSTNILGNLTIEQPIINQQTKFQYSNSGGVGAYLSLFNTSNTAGSSTGISFGIGNSNAQLDGGDWGEGQIKVYTDSGQYGNMEFNVHTGANRSYMKIVGNGGGFSGAGAGTEGMTGGVAFGNAGIAIDRSWMGQPGIHVFNQNNVGDTDQGTFRFHGWNRSYASYPSSSGSDFAVNVTGDGSGFSSDERKKIGITTITNALNTVAQLRGVSYKFVNSELKPQTHMTMDSGTKLGFVAQEVIPLLPSIVIDAGGEKAVPHENGWCDRYCIDYGSVTPLLAEAIKELKAKNEALEARIAALEGS